MAELVHIRLDTKMRKAMRAVIQKEHFVNETEFIRDSIRKNLDTYTRLQMLASARGTAKLRKTPAGSPPSDIFRAFGLDKVRKIS